MNSTNHNAVSVSLLEKRFGSFIAVNKISFDVKRGEVFGFLGPNGAGKSTTIKMLCGLFTPTSGTGQVAGFDIIRQQERIKQNIGYMSQRFSLYEDLTVEENIDFYSGLYKIPADAKKSRKESILNMANLQSLRHNLTKTLAAGWKQRLALGCAIIHQPPVLFLDEPTSGVDPIMRNHFWLLIKQMAREGVTVFVTTHYMDEAENCHRLALIYKGSIIAIGTPKELKADSMKDYCLQIRLPNPEEWLGKLKALPGVKETALFGTNLHCIVANIEAATRQIGQFLRQQMAESFSMKQIEPSLEDVFVSLIDSFDRQVNSR
jgi:ABC-2 type transport system ATP-binding protein